MCVDERVDLGEQIAYGMSHGPWLHSLGAECHDSGGHGKSVSHVE